MIKKLITAFFAVMILSLPICALAEDSSISTPNISVTTTTGSATFTLKSDSKGAKIYYTTNGDDPTTSSKKYSSSVKVTSSCEVRAVAYEGGDYSPVGYYTVTVTKARANTPTFKSTNVDGGKKVTITSSGSTIYYTTDGSTPTTSDKRYTSSGIVVNESCYIKAIAVRSGYQNSSVATAYVDIPQFSGKVTLTPTTSGSYTTIKLSSSYKDCSFFYTTDGSDPQPKASGSTKKYSSSGIRLTSACTLRIIICRPGYAPSTVRSYNFSGPACSAPTATKTAVDGGYKVTLKSATSGASIYYTVNGGTPTTDDYKYSSSGVIIDQPGTNYIRAIAVKNGYEDSTVSVFSISMTQLSKPKATLVNSSSTSSTRKIKLTASSGAYIYYTTDGSDPTTKDKKISSGSTISVPNNCIVRAIATKKGYAPSDVASFSINYENKVATPTASESKSTNYTKVTLKCSTSGATIYFSLDGSDPVRYGEIYRTAIKIEESCVLRAVAVKDGYDDSDVLVRNITVNGDDSGVVVLGSEAGTYNGSAPEISDGQIDLSEPDESELTDTGAPDTVTDTYFPDMDETETTVWDEAANDAGDVYEGSIDL